MLPKVDDLLDQAMRLPEEDRLQLAEALLSSMGPSEAPPFDAEWLVEARRRAARIDSGEGKLNTWEEVREQARRRLEEPIGG